MFISHSNLPCVKDKQISKIRLYTQLALNPLSPHNTLKHYFTSLKTDLISWNLVVLDRKFSWNCFKNDSIFYHLSPTSSHFHPLQVENCDSNSRLVVDENDNGKVGLKGVKGLKHSYTYIYQARSPNERIFFHSLIGLDSRLTRRRLGTSDSRLESWLRRLKHTCSCCRFLIIVQHVTTCIKKCTKYSGRRTNNFCWI